MCKGRAMLVCTQQLSRFFDYSLITTYYEQAQLVSKLFHSNGHIEWNNSSLGVMPILKGMDIAYSYRSRPMLANQDHLRTAAEGSTPWSRHYINIPVEY